MQLRCKKCATDVVPDNINIREAMAMCSQCGAIFSFTGFDLAAYSQNSRKVQQPFNMERVMEDETLQLCIPYHEGYQVSPIRQLLVALILVLVSLLTAITGVLLFPGTGVMIWLLPVVLFSLVAMVVLTIDSKQCELEFSPDALSVEVSEGSSENVFFARGDIADIFCEESPTSRERFGASQYNIFVRSVNRKDHLLIAKLPEPQARYTTRELQRHLQRGEDIETLVNEVETALIFHDEAFTLYPEEPRRIDIFAENVDELLAGFVDYPEPVELTDEYRYILESLTGQDEEAEMSFDDFLDDLS